MGAWRLEVERAGRWKIASGFFLFFVTAFRWEKEFLGLGHWRVAKKMG
jgi:hypothetical protein